MQAPPEPELAVLVQVLAALVEQGLVVIVQVVPGPQLQAKAEILSAWLVRLVVLAQQLSATLLELSALVVSIEQVQHLLVQVKRLEQVGYWQRQLDVQRPWPFSHHGPDITLPGTAPYPAKAC